jgi:hypothetical protein
MARKNLLQCHHVTDEKMIFKSVLHALARVSILFGHAFPDGGLDGSEECRKRSRIFSKMHPFIICDCRKYDIQERCLHAFARVSILLKKFFPAILYVWQKRCVTSIPASF